ncbi:MAG: IclR family transcriptional regulator [Sphingomonadales bacterium]|nr:MAG: IclR family transcriptional regulator [Sphingomonadales bacterium]
MSGTQTLTRGLDLISAVADRPLGLAELSERVGLTRSTVHRLACTLAEHRYLKFVRGSGYSLGPRLLELGFLAGRQSSLPRVARDHLEVLAAHTGDTVYLGVQDGMRALYLDKIPGGRRVEVSAGIGERLPLRSTGLGKALIIDADEESLRGYYDYEARQGHGYGVPIDVWLRRMRGYAADGYALDLEENGDQIRCVAAPIRDVTGAVAGAISVASAAQYMDDTRVHGLAFAVKSAADMISIELGYVASAATPARAPGKKRTVAARTALSERAASDET